MSFAGRKRKGKGGRNDSRGLSSHLDKRQRKHLEQFGEAHPADLREIGNVNYRKVKDEDESRQEIQDVASESSSEEEDEVSPFQQLVSTLSSRNRSSSSSDDDYDAAAGKEVEELESDASELDDSGSDAGEIEDTEKQIDSEDTSESEGDEHSEMKDKDVEHLSDDYREEENQSDTDDEKDRDVMLKERDPFTVHFENDIPEELAERSAQQLTVPHVGRCARTLPKNSALEWNAQAEKDLKKLHVKHKLLAQLALTNKKMAKANLGASDLFTSFQSNLFNIVNQYQDLCFSSRNGENGEEIRVVYCLHAVNHVLKTRSRVIAHNAKIKSKREDIPDDYRDQGLTRPKVLIVLPFRESALRVVQILSHLLASEDQAHGLVENKKRFYKEYSEGEGTEVPENKPDDFKEIFAGNIDDHFRIGVGVAKKSLKLYTKFYSSDIILASPLGLRTIVGSDGDETRDHDFLSSIEVLIFDQTDVFLMQNWDHINHLMSHMHLQPKEGHGVDFSRVRMWTLNGWSKFYRQTLIFSSVAVPEINALFNKHCHNYAGKIQVQKEHSRGSICQIHTQLPQVFHRIEASSYADMADARFEYFKSKVLPQYKDEVMAGTMIFVPSYFDFVRLRNFFKAKELDFAHISEYSTEKQISRARNGFNKRGKHFLLFTERFHFYHRLKIRGIKHIVFYALPTYPHLYSELCNLIPDPQRSSRAVNWDVAALYAKYDAHRLAAVVGSARVAQMLHAEKHMHMFVTGDK